MEKNIRLLPTFEYFAPRSLTDLLGLLTERSSQASLMAGGTDLIPWMKKRAVSPGVILDINQIPELSFIQTNGDTLRIGAATRLNEIKGSQVVRQNAPLLIEAIQTLRFDGLRLTSSTVRCHPANLALDLPRSVHRNAALDTSDSPCTPFREPLGMRP